eukprot:5841450-Prymnesium_polylepis.1
MSTCAALTEGATWGACAVSRNARRAETFSRRSEGRWRGRAPAPMGCCRRTRRRRNCGPRARPRGSTSSPLMSPGRPACGSGSCEECNARGKGAARVRLTVLTRVARDAEHLEHRPLHERQNVVEP